MLAESIVPRMLKTIVIPLLGRGCDSGVDEAVSGAVVEETAPSKFTASAGHIGVILSQASHAEKLRKSETVEMEQKGPDFSGPIAV